MALLNFGDFIETTLQGGISNIATEIVVPTGASAAFNAQIGGADFMIRLASAKTTAALGIGEKMRVTNVDVPTETWTVTRTAGQAWTSGTQVLHLLETDVLLEVQNIAQLNTVLQEMVAFNYGNNDGVVPGAYNSLEITELDTPTKSVEIDTGLYWLDETPYKLDTLVVSPALATPSGGNDRIDLVRINNIGEVTIQEGVEHATTPVAPTLDAGYLLLANVYVNDGMSSITNLDITDMRNFL